MKTYVVQELRTGVPLDVVGIEVAPTQLNVDPELVARSTIQYVFALCHGIYQQLLQRYSILNLHQ